MFDEALENAWVIDAWSFPHHQFMLHLPLDGKLVRSRMKESERGRSPQEPNRSVAVMFCKLDIGVAYMPA